MKASTARPTTRSASHGDILSAIGRSLQRVYAPVVDAPLPDHLAQFISRIEQRDLEGKH